MSQNLLNKYVWLVDTIYKAGKIPFKEINRRWLESDLSEGVEMPLRTFHTWLNEAQDIFGLVIQCQRKGGYLYYIENAEEIERGGLRNWLLGTLSVSNTLLQNQALNDRILLEDIPSGHACLTTVLSAMRLGKLLHVTYQGYYKDHESSFDLAPYCVKLFHQRWYVIGDSLCGQAPRTYALDRVRSLSVSEASFDYPADFNPAGFFASCYGVIREDTGKPETIRLKATAHQACYLRSLPLHSSQREIETNDTYSVFELKLCPTFDFLQELLSQADRVEVLAPESLRRQLMEEVERTWKMYKGDAAR
ncbi:MAG: WYL domain-containing protein [Paludibacteraceae bacterium]|nr:WYL domain-containing protein [Paludibacteraceae bacterium]